MDLAELSRRLENVIRFGTILEVDHASTRCRVKSGKLDTNWLRWFEARAGETKTWNPPTVGEQCVIFSPSGEVENGMVFYGAPSDVIDTPSHDPVKHIVKLPDGATFTYDHAASHLEITGIKTATICASDSITNDTPLTHCTGRLTVDDLLTYGNGIAGTGGDWGNVITGNFFHTEGVLNSNGIVVHDHGHENVMVGGDVSGKPVAGHT